MTFVAISFCLTSLLCFETMNIWVFALWMAVEFGKAKTTFEKVEYVFLSAIGIFSNFAMIEAIKKFLGNVL